MLYKSALVSSASEEARRLRRARERLLAGDEPEPGSVRDVILASWKRSRAAGVNPQWGIGGESRAVRPSSNHQDRRLAALAGPIFACLRQALSDHPYLLMLTGCQCEPLLFAGNGESVAEGDRINAAAGGVWREDLVGTDAVALCHAIGKPVQVHWYEHYASIADPWTGNSHPIREPITGKIAGTLNLYAYGCIAHPQAFELASEAGAAIERLLILDEQRLRSHLLESYVEHVGRYPSDAALCVSRQGTVVTMSSPALKDLRLTRNEIQGQPVSRIAGLMVPPQMGALEALAPLREEAVAEGRRWRSEWQEIRHEAEVTGYLVRLHRSGRSAVRGATATPHADSAWRARWTFDDIVGDSLVLRRTMEEARIVALKDWNVLLQGESGTGKELFAHSIHAASNRAAGPFVSINCGGVTGELLAAELFGYEEGSFTGAARGGRPGKIAIAHGGTLFLDEVEAMPPAMQAQLLRVLEDHLVIRVGGQVPQLVDVRIIAATNIDLGELVAQRVFRADLHHRLAVWPLTIPPLRERRADIGQLCRALLRQQGVQAEVAPSAMRALEQRSWPGNIRELRNVLLQASVRANGASIDLAHLPLDRAQGNIHEPSAPSLAAAECSALLDALQRNGGCIGITARELGLHRATLYRKLRRHGCIRDNRYLLSAERANPTS